MLTRDEVMSAREVSDLFRMPTSTVYELARKGVLPARQLGRSRRFDQERNGSREHVQCVGRLRFRGNVFLAGSGSFRQRGMWLVR
jgi:excisionase family DNA binding protein